jgi:hypothetical protein
MFEKSYNTHFKCIYHPAIHISLFDKNWRPADYVWARKLLGTYMNMSPPKDCMNLTLVVGFAWSNESRSYAGRSVATGRVSHARLVCDEDPD